jgi:type IV pilus assembly protein PilA
MFKALRKGQKGFTLIELLIVVAILGILAAVIIPNVAGFMVTGKLNAANTEAENVKTAALAYYAEHSGYPVDSTSLTTNFIAGTPNATYSFDNATGFITTATPSGSSAWTGITWDTAPAVGSRKWKRG